MKRFFSILALCICLAGTVYQSPAQLTAELQFIHNSADPAMQQVDVYLNGTKIQDDFSAHTATSMQTVLANTPMLMVVATSGSQSAADGVLTVSTVGPFTAGEQYIAMTGGVGTIADFTANPDGRDIRFAVNSIAGVRTGSQNPNQVDLRFIHGSTDMAGMDVNFRGGAQLAEGALYGDAQGYISIDPGDYTIDVTAPGDTTPIASYRLDFTPFTGQAMTVVSAGFHNPSANGNGREFGLYGVTSTGMIVNFPEVALPTVQVQLMNLSADPSQAQLDVYINGEKMADDIGFRTSAALDIPVGVPVALTIAESGSTSIMDRVLHTSTMTALSAGSRYLMVMGGVHTTGDFAQNPDGSDIALQAYTIADVRARAQDDTMVDVFAFHGATDVPAIDIVQSGNGSVFVDGVGYGGWSSYSSLEADMHNVTLRSSADTTQVYGSFRADLSGMEGEAVVLFTAGFNDPSTNRNGSNLGLYALRADGSVQALSRITEGPTASVQFIHTSADPAVQTLDLYVNGQRMSDDMMFNTASGPMNVAANTILNVALAPGNSTSLEGNMLSSAMIGPLAADQNYVFLVSGLSTTNGFSTNPDSRNISLSITSIDSIRASSGDPSQMDLYFHHSISDAASIDIVERGGAARVESLGYGDASGYVSMSPGNYVFDIMPAGNSTPLASFDANFAGMAGRTAFVYASGFASPDMNQNGQPLRLYAVMNNGTVLQLPQHVGETRPALVQFIHNGADPLAASVDMYMDGMLVADNANFRTATSFMNVPSGRPVQIAVANSSSMSSTDGVMTTATLGPLSPDQRYVVMVGGVGSGGGFASNPDGISTNMQLYTIGDIRSSALNPSMVDVRMIHGATDAPGMHIDVQGGSRVVNNMSYGGSADYFSIAPGMTTFHLSRAGNGQMMSSHTADFSGLAGMPVTVFSSGFMDPSMNNNGQPFGLFAAMPNGSVLPLTLATTDVAETASVSTVENYPNPSSTETFISYELAVPQPVTLTVFDAFGRIVMTLDAGVKEAGSHAIKVQTSALAPGMYAYSVKAGATSATGTLVVVR